jgi:hypothetical protein
MAKESAKKSVESYKHDEASRKNIPTVEYQSVMMQNEENPIRVVYERRNRDLDPQLVWRGKDEQDWSDLVVESLSYLSHMMPKPGSKEPPSPSWVQVYRELVEWATLYRIVKTKDFATDTIIVFDGLLRSKVFSKTFFIDTIRLISKVIEEKKRSTRRSIYVVGLAKHSKVITRYRLAMFAESIMLKDYPVALPVPSELEEKSYVWREYSRTTGQAEAQGGEVNKFVE